MKRLDTVTDWQQQQQQQQDQTGAQLQMTTPVRAPGFVSDLVVPFGQSVVTGFFFSSLVTFIVGQTDYRGKLTPVWVGLLLAIATVVWLVLLVDTRRLLRTIEKLTGLDLDGDGVVGKEQLVLVNAPAARKEAREQAEARAKADTASELATFVARLPSIGTDSRTWDTRIGRDRYTAFRDVLLEMGWAEWKSARDKRQGWRLVLPVREILQRISDDD